MKYEYNCLMANFNIPDWNELVKKLIKPEDIYDTEDHEFGLETEPHITILWGINPEIKLTLVKKYLIPLTYLDDIEMNDISIFECADYDVVKFNVKSETLTKLNTHICKYIPYTKFHDDYNAHMTIAYVKKGTGDKYIKYLRKPIKLIPEKYSYSMTNGTKKYLRDKDLAK
jgi:2'-5' RNA ligase